MAYGGGRGGGGRGRYDSGRNDQDFDNSMRGALFENEKQDTDNAPHMRGQAEVNGVEFWVSGWWKKSKKGMEFMSLAFTPKDEQSNQRNDQRAPYGPGNRPGNSRGPGARVGQGGGRSNGQRDDDTRSFNQNRHPNAPPDEMDDDIPF